MKLCFINDSLGSGGAERQIVELATGIKIRGYEVEVVYYHPDSFFKSQLENAGITVTRLYAEGRISKILTVRKWISKTQPDILHGFGRYSSALISLANLFGNKTKIVVSDWFGGIPSKSFVANLREIIRLSIIRHIFIFADHIITESQTNRKKIISYVPALKNKISVFNNLIDLEKFKHINIKEKNETFRFICVASVSSRKNFISLIKAVIELKKNTKKPFIITWVGAIPKKGTSDGGMYQEAQKLISNNGLEDVFYFSGQREDVVTELHQSDAFVLVSKMEGMPNALWEGMACGLPVVASSVSNIPDIVNNGVNGFLCDPFDVSSITEALSKTLKLSDKEFISFEIEARKSIEKHFNKEQLLDNYEVLYKRLLQK